MGFAEVLLSKFEDYYDPDETKFYREDVRNFFAECEEEQIGDIFEFFEEENGFDTAEDDGESQWVNVTQIMALLRESQKEPGDAMESMKKKAPRLAPGIADALKDAAQFSDSDQGGGDPNVDGDGVQRKKKRKKTEERPVFAAIDDLDSSSDGGDMGFFASNKKRDLKDFGLSDSDNSDFGLGADLNAADPVTKGDDSQGKKLDIDPTKL